MHPKGACRGCKHSILALVSTWKWVSPRAQGKPSFWSQDSTLVGVLWVKETRLRMTNHILLDTHRPVNLSIVLGCHVIVDVINTLKGVNLTVSKNLLELWFQSTCFIDVHSPSSSWLPLRGNKADLLDNGCSWSPYHGPCQRARACFQSTSSISWNGRTNQHLCFSFKLSPLRLVYTIQHSRVVQASGGSNRTTQHSVTWGNRIDHAWSFGPCEARARWIHCLRVGTLPPISLNRVSYFPPRPLTVITTRETRKGSNFNPSGPLNYGSVKWLRSVSLTLFSVMSRKLRSIPLTVSLICSSCV